MDVNQYLARVKEELERWKIPSLALGVVKDDQILLAEGFGHADIKEEKSPDADTLYQIGSCTKSFTAAAAALLVDSGKLEWDKPARYYLPWLRFKDPYLTEHVTVRDLLCHRTGLARYDAFWYAGNCTRRQMVENLQNMDSLYGFREGWNYQNYGYVTVGMIIEELSGMTWESFVQKNLLNPLHMDRTMFYTGEMNADNNHAKPYALKKQGDAVCLHEISNFCSPAENRLLGIGAPYGPAGSIISTVSDMLKWVQLHMNHGIVENRQLISEASIKELHRINMVMAQPLVVSAPQLDFHGYGMGWFIESYRGHKLLEHSGNIDGFSSMVFFCPDLNTGGIELINCSGSLITYALMYELIDKVLDISDVDWHERLRKMVSAQAAEVEKQILLAEKTRISDTLPSHSISEYTGVYEAAAYGDVTISERDGVLYLHYGKRAPERLEHFHYDTFSVSDPDSLFYRMKIHFGTNAAGTVDSLQFRIGLDPRQKDEVFTRKVN